MTRYAFEAREPHVDKSAWIAPTAAVIGSVRLAAQSSVWFGAVLRGDNDWIEIGAETNVQDAAVIHTDEGFPTRIGARVTIGHQAMLHSCTVGDETLIGNGAMVLDRAVIGRHCIIAARALVPPDAVIPDGSLVMGLPGKVVRMLSDADIARLQGTAERYVAKARAFGDGLRVRE
jgi:carbonic anhydrase/acetyltransferase-like protein (isoleucine patch superfamily)